MHPLGNVWSDTCQFYQVSITVNRMAAEITETFFLDVNAMAAAATTVTEEVIRLYVPIGKKTKTKTEVANDESTPTNDINTEVRTVDGEIPTGTKTETTVPDGLKIVSKNGAVVVPSDKVAHLSSRSSYFASLLGAGMIESTSRVVKKLDWDVVTTRKIVDLLVNRAVDVDVYQIGAMLTALDQICLDTVFQSPFCLTTDLSSASVRSAIAKLSVSGQTTSVTFNNINSERLEWQELADIGIVALKSSGIKCKLLRESLTKKGADQRGSFATCYW